MGAGDSKPHKFKYKERPSQQDEKTEIKKEEEINEKIKIENNSEQKKITVIIPLKCGSWENSYDIDTPLSKVESEFKIGNNMTSIKKNHFIEFSYKNNPITMDSNPIKSIINYDTSTIHLEYEIKPIPGIKLLEDYEIINIIGKPISDPFQIYTFEIKSQIIKIIKFKKEEQIQQLGLDKFGPESAYCNGNDFLYISGTIDQESDKAIGQFWIFDLDKKIFDNPIYMNPKKNHSMIYIEKKVYIVGGDDIETMFYDVDKKEIRHSADLNYKRFEPSLIKHNNFLFCFDTSQKYLNNTENIFNFEKLDLYSESAEWEIIKPEISKNIVNSIFSQKFFGIVEDYKENIIFVGGVYDNDNKENDLSNNKDYKNLQYNTSINMIEKSDTEFKEISFSEKTFLPYDDKIYYLLPNFNKRAPKIVYFNRERNLVEIKSYHSKSRHKEDINKIKTTQIKPSLEGLNFDMPKKSDIFGNNNFIKENYASNDNKDNKIYNNDLNNLNSEKNGKYDNNDFNNDNNKSEDKEHEKIKNQKQKDDNKDNNTDNNKITSNLNRNDINKSNKDENNSLDENKINNNIDQNSEKKEDDINNNKNNTDEIKKGNSMKKSEKEEEKNNTNNINDTNSKKEIKPKNEESIKNEEFKNTIKDSNKLEISENEIILEKDDNVQKVLYVEKPEILVNYHSSLDNQFNNNLNSNAIIKDIKMRKNVPPMNIDRKSLVKQINKIKKSQFNEFRENKNY